MVTPRVVEEVRNHFGCPDLEGAELEDQVLELEHANEFFPSHLFFFQGGDGTAMTHWEKRLFQDEAMTGTVHTQDPAYSRYFLRETGFFSQKGALGAHFSVIGNFL